MNLIVCCTPLQVLIAEKIIDLYPDEKFYGLMLAPLINNKYDYYYKRLQNKCIVSDLIIENDYSRWGLIGKLKTWTAQINAQYVINNVFVANLNKFFIQGILSYIHYQEFLTFDDGTASLIGFVNKTSLSGVAHKILKLYLNIDDNITNMENNRKKHFSIYRDVVVNSPTQFINLVDISKNSFNNIVKKELSILLGQPLFLDESKNYRVVNYLLEKYKIDYYFPHPRETFTSYICQDKVIYSELIIEDYIIELLKEYQTIKVYHFFSSAGLNLAYIKNIEVICFYVDDVDCVDNAGVKEVYNLFKAKAVKMIDV